MMNDNDAPQNGVERVNGDKGASNGKEENASGATEEVQRRRSEPVPEISVQTVQDVRDRELPPLPPEASREDREQDMSPSLRPVSSTRGTSPDSASVADSARPRSPSVASVYGTQKPPSASSVVFVVSALEAIAQSKDARKRKQLGDATQKALDAIKAADPQLPDPEIVFQPLQLATLTGSVPLATTALDCIGKLISYSYFSAPFGATQAPADGKNSPLPLIERAIDTIIDCFQGEATPNEIQLQIVKSLLAAVLNDKIVVHGAGLLKAVRQTYNIFLLSKSSANQQIAQGTLTQMIGTVFERLKLRLTMKEARLSLQKHSPSRTSENQSPTPMGVQTPSTSKDDLEDAPETVGSPSTTTSDGQGTKETREKITLQSFENRKSFDDDRINDNAPTMVTRPPAGQQSRQLSGLSIRRMSTRDGRGPDEVSDEDEEDEIYIKDAFLVFRAMCKLSIKSLPPEQLLDVKSHGMRSKLLSLHLVHTILRNHMIVFTSPLATIRGGNNDDPSSFLHATKQYLCLSLSRNGASSVNRVFAVCCEIFWLMLRDLRVVLKVRHFLQWVLFAADVGIERNRGVPEGDISCNLG